MTYIKQWKTEQNIKLLMAWVMPKHAFKKLYLELKFFVNIIIIIIIIMMIMMMMIIIIINNNNIIIIIMMMIMMMMIIIIINNNNIALGNTGKRKQELTGWVTGSDSFPGLSRNGPQDQ